jgi:hypothetical protein
VTISTRTTDRSHFLIFANTYEAALYEEDISSTDSNGSPNALKVTPRQKRKKKYRKKQNKTTPDTNATLLLSLTLVVVMII